VDSILEKLRGEPSVKQTTKHDSPVEPLSEQEIRIVQMMSAGLSNQQIAEGLYISVGTVKWHVHNILGKLGTASRTHAVSRAREYGILS